MDNLNYAEAILFAGKIGKTVFCDWNRYYREQLELGKSCDKLIDRKKHDKK